MEKRYEVYVEDILASCIVKEVLKDHHILNFTKVIVYGDACNAFTIAAGLELEGTIDSNKLILLDGDVYRTDEEKMRQMRKRLGGNEAGRDDRRHHALSIVKQLALPESEQPEHYLWTLLKTKQGELADLANQISRSPDDNHCYLYDIFELQGEDKETYYRNVVATIKGDPAWAGYVSPITDWIGNLN